MPSTPNKKFSIPNTGADVGTWGSADLNPNFTVIDNIFGSVTTLNLAGGGNVTLSDAQQQVAIIRLTGALPNNVNVTFSEPGFWTIDNQTTGNFVVNLTIGGQSIATPQGSRYQCANDGTNFFFVNLGEPGIFKKFCVTSTPAWMSACSVPPYLICRGGTALIATFPALFAILGTTFGGNGSTTFGIPDLQGRAEFDLDNGAGRISSATFSPNGNTLGATGGLETNPITAANLPALPFAGTQQTWNINQNNVPFNESSGNVSLNPGSFSVPFGGSVGQVTVTVTPAGTVNSGSANTPITNIPPAMVNGVTFIKT